MKVCSPLVQPLANVPGYSICIYSAVIQTSCLWVCSPRNIFTHFAGHGDRNVNMGICARTIYSKMPGATTMLFLVFKSLYLHCLLQQHFCAVSPLYSLSYSSDPRLLNSALHAHPSAAQNTHHHSSYLANYISQRLKNYQILTAM